MIAGVHVRYRLLFPALWGRGGEGGIKNTFARALAPSLTPPHTGGENGQSRAPRFVDTT
jgi:hypothetical protein